MALRWKDQSLTLFDLFEETYKPAFDIYRSILESFFYAFILTPSENLAFGPKSGFKNKCRSRAGFGLQSEVLLQLCVGMYAESNKGRLNRYILHPTTVK